MKIRAVGDLRRYLNERALSPEAFAQECLISNMTIRRLLSQDDQKTVPQKYWATLDRAAILGGSAFPTEFLKFNEFITDDFSDFAKTLEDSGKVEFDVDQMQKELGEKNRSAHVGTKLKELVLTLFDALKSDTVMGKDKVLVVGALLYFLNPVDLIPDTLPGVGYLDDYAALSMVAARVIHQAKTAPSKVKKESPDQA